ncbi:hypothetical protein NIES4074_36410 [Cylindrospermum sp. NIES-4074]|nr:hypothetical protein NIES4074_36410 [Cylindrospermum sp. NIES-4074]
MALTKQELIAALEPFPDNAEILVGTNAGPFSVACIEEDGPESAVILVADDDENNPL